MNDRLLVTPMEDKAMRYLSNKMEVTSAMVGVNVSNRLCSWPTKKGAAVMGALRKKGYVMRLPELNSWRLTRKGWEYVSKR